MRLRRPFAGALARRGWKTAAKSHAALGCDLEDSRLGEKRHMAVEAGRRDVSKRGGQLSDGERSISEERLDDPEPNGVEQHVRTRHEPHTSLLFS